MKTNILITIDTEHSMGGYFADPENLPVTAERIIWCRIGDKEYGINLIMDILDHFGFKAVFFVEVEARFHFGDKGIADIIAHIRNRGHDVQLHTHPNYRTFKEGRKMPDDFRRYTLDDQKKIIDEALTFMNGIGVKNILAHRSGGFYSNHDTLEAQRACGIKYSSNYNLAFPNCTYIDTLPQINDIYALDGLYELPVTNYQEPEIRKKWNSMQLSAASFSEMKSVLEFSHKNQVRVITFITHSFEFVKTADDQYQTVRQLPFLIKRFENFCRYLYENRGRFQVLTFSELEQEVKENPALSENREPVFYKSTLLQTGLRYLENARARI